MPCLGLSGTVWRWRYHPISSSFSSLGRCLLKSISPPIWMMNRTHQSLRKERPLISKTTPWHQRARAKCACFHHFQNLTEAYSLVAHRGHSDTVAGMITVKRCQTAASEKAYELLFNRIDEQLTILDREFAEAKTDRNRLVEIATSFLPQQSMLAGNTGNRSRRAIGTIAAAPGAAGLILGVQSKTLHVQLYWFSAYAQTI